jgi:cephalosporin hydroxylase
MNPSVIIEFGTLHGYSAVAMAQALRDLKYLKSLKEYHFLNGSILFEGGSKERDKVEWMKDFQPINSSGINFITINEDFPSLSLML